MLIVSQGRLGVFVFYVFHIFFLYFPVGYTHLAVDDLSNCLPLILG